MRTARSSRSVRAAGAAREDRADRTNQADRADRASGSDRTGFRKEYRAGEVAQILAVSRRQLQYWAQTDLIRPSQKTPGGHARYSFQDLVALKAAKRLIDAGVSVQRIRKSIRALRGVLPAVREPLSELVLVATGDVVLAFRDGAAFDAVSGQEWVFEVAELERDIEDWERSRPGRSAPPRASVRPLLSVPKQAG